MKRAFRLSLACARRGVEYRSLALALLLSLGAATDARAGDYDVAHRLVLKKRWAEALPLLENLHREAPNSSLVSNDLAQTLLRMNRRAEAMRLFRRFGSDRMAEIAGRTFILQESYRLYQEGLNFLEARNLNLARERFEKAYERDRDQLEILLRLIQVETLDLRPDSALKWVQATRELHGNIVELLIWEGQSLHLLRRYDEAARKLTAAVRELPRSENAALALAETLYSQKNRPSLNEHLESDLKRNPLHLRVVARKIGWDLDQLQTRATASSEPLKALAFLESRIERLSESKLPRFESELGLELLDPEALKKDLITLKARAEQLKKRSAL